MTDPVTATNGEGKVENGETDGKLIENALHGDSSAYSTLYERYRIRLKKQMWKLAGEEAEEYAHAGLTQAFLSLKLFNGESQFYTWLYRITINCYLMSKRKRRDGRLNIVYSLDSPATNSRTSGGAGEEGEDSENGHNLFPSHDRRLERTPDRQILLKCLNALPEGQSEFFILHHLEGYEHHEIAQMLNCHVGTSKSQVHKAKLRLRYEMLRNQRVRISRPNPRPSALEASPSLRARVETYFSTSGF